MRMRDEAMLATRGDVERLAAELRGALHATRNALTARWNRALRRLVLTLSALMVASATAVLLATWVAR
jgi:hypothetical protein